MLKFLRSLASFAFMAIPLWVVFVGIYGFQPATLVVELEEPDVQVFLNREEHKPEAGVIGPIELDPGEYQLLIARGAVVLYDYPIVLEPAAKKVIQARWGASRGSTVVELDEEGSVEPSRRHYESAPSMD